MKKLFSIKINWKEINIPLLVFLVLFLNVKFVVKLAAIIFIIAYSKNLKLGLSWKNSRLPLFYALTIIIECFKYLAITRNYTLQYSLVFGLGILQWIVSLLALHNIKLMVEKDSSEKLHNTVKVFFLANFLVSMFFFSLLIFHPIWLTYWGHGADISFSHPSAGDTILGISFDTSTVNATFNCFGLIYFLYKKEYLFSLICILIIVLCTSNVTCALILATLGLMFISVRSKKLRWAVFFAGFTLLALYILISPTNREYIRTYFVQLYILNKNPELARSIKPDTLVLGNDTIIVPPEYQTGRKVNDSVYTYSNRKLGKAFGHMISIRSNDTSKVPQLILTEASFRSKPGKLISFYQTYNYLRHDVSNFLFGAGIGNFSSKLAFRVSGANILGSYPKKFEYTSPEFEKNHLETFLFYFHSEASEHSVVNYPFAVYNQVLGEYGAIGGILFAFFYLGYFLKRFKRLTYGRYMIVALLGFFFMEYWFELFSLVILFELFMLMNIKEGREDLKSIRS